MTNAVPRRLAALALGCGLSGWLACSPSFSAREGEASAGSAGSAAAAGRDAGGGGSAGAGAGGAGAEAGDGGVRPSGGRGGSTGGDAGAAAAAGSDDRTSGGAGGDEADAGAGGTPAEPPSYRDMIVAASPLAYWRMGIESGPVVPDEIGDNDLVLQGSGHARGLAGAIPGDEDGAIGFDGSASYAIATDARAFDFADGVPFTLECWARHDGGGDSYFQHLISNTEGSPGARNGYILYFLPETESADTARSSFELDRIGAEISAWGPKPEVAAWTHFAAVSDGSGIALYVAGTQAGTAAIDGAMSARTGPFAVARASNEEARYFKGALDEIAVYSRALGIAEVVAHATFAR